MLPVLLIGHAANTRLAWELFQMPSDYARVVTNLWVADQQGMQLGLLAPGWLHGCLGLHFVFNRRPLYRRLRYVLFAFALLVPVFSAMGFIAMGRALAANPEITAAALDYLGPANAAQRLALAQWRNNLLIGYFSIIGATFAARAIRNALERGRGRLVSISYPGRTVRVPRGWSVLEASRGFHLPHASVCGGRARCSTCRVRVTAGEDVCPPAEQDERATLARIEAPPDVRLPVNCGHQSDISVIPLVRTERPHYRPMTATGAAPSARSSCCSATSSTAPSSPASTCRRTSTCSPSTSRRSAIASAPPATISYVELDSLCALFGLERDPAQAARQALQAAGAIEKAISELNERLGRQWDCKVEITVSIHAGPAVVGEIGSSDPPAMMAIGEAMDVANELRKAAAARRKPFAISQPVYAAAGLEGAAQDQVMLSSPRSAAPVAAFLSASAPVLPPSSGPLAERRAAPQRLWGQ